MCLRTCSASPLEMLVLERGGGRKDRREKCHEFLFLSRVSCEGQALTFVYLSIGDRRDLAIWA